MVVGGLFFYDLLLWFPNQTRIKRKAFLFLLFCVEYNTALPEDYNIHQNWKIAVEIYQFWAASSNYIPLVAHTDRQTIPGRSITLFRLVFLSVVLLGKQNSRVGL
jgi:hypothetical protein